jgi:hypothetical protein
MPRFIPIIDSVLLQLFRVEQLVVSVEARILHASCRVVCNHSSTLLGIRALVEVSVEGRVSAEVNVEFKVLLPNRVVILAFLFQGRILAHVARRWRRQALLWASLFGLIVTLDVPLELLCKLLDHIVLVGSIWVVIALELGKRVFGRL